MIWLESEEMSNGRGGFMRESLVYGDQLPRTLSQNRRHLLRSKVRICAKLLLHGEFVSRSLGELRTMRIATAIVLAAPTQLMAME